MKHVFEGPDQYWSPDLAASRGQLATIAHQACKLLGLPTPANRLEASMTIARLHAAIEKHPEAPPRGDPGLLMLDHSTIDEARRSLGVLDRDQAQDLVETAAIDRINRARRPTRIAPRSQARCRRCNLFVANPSRACGSCGYIDMGLAA